MGFDVAMAYELARSLDVKLWFIPFAWDELRADLGAGRFDIAMSGIYLASDIHNTSLRIHTLDPSEPYYRSNLVLMVPSAEGGSVSLADRCRGNEKPADRDPFFTRNEGRGAKLVATGESRLRQQFL